MTILIGSRIGTATNQSQWWLLLIIKLSFCLLEQRKKEPLSLEWESACVNAQSCLTLCQWMDCRLPVFSVHGIFFFSSKNTGAVAISSSRRYSPRRFRTSASCVCWIARGFLDRWAIREAPEECYVCASHVSEKSREPGAAESRVWGVGTEPCRACCRSQLLQAGDEEIWALGTFKLLDQT